MVLLRRLRSKQAAVIVVSVGLAVGSIATVATLANHAASRRDAQLTLARVQTELNQYQGFAWGSIAPGGSVASSRRQMASSERLIERLVTELRSRMPTRELGELSRRLLANFDVNGRIAALNAQRLPIRATRLAPLATSSQTAATKDVNDARDQYAQGANSALNGSIWGSAGVIAALLVAFLFFYLRAARAGTLARRLAVEKSVLAHTDALTGLQNRRSMMDDLTRAIPVAGEPGRVLALFDLDGFKQYNDTFGHPAGDALLLRLGGRLSATMRGLGTAYRMGGDEFCVLAPAGSDGGESVARLAAAALTELGEAFEIGCSYGLALLPAEADSPERALALTDQRMYEQKGSSRSSAGRQSADVLLKVLGEQSCELEEHISDVARLAQLTAQRLGLSETDVQGVRLASELHDVGKAAIPAEILNKAGKLNEDEWEFMRRHTLIGERIVLAAPALAYVAPLVRASHERIDGYGYPDGLRGDEIPLGSRIIAISDAFDAMISNRPYSNAVSVKEALAELDRCRGTQFDAEIVTVFGELVEELERSASQSAGHEHDVAGETVASSRSQP